MTESVEVQGVPLRVTPVLELPWPYNLVGGIIISRIQANLEAGEMSLHEDFAQLAELCIQDGVKAETVKQLSNEDMATVLDAMLEEPEVNE